MAAAMICASLTWLAPAPASDAHAGLKLEAYYPEGPLVAGHEVLFAEMHRDRVVAWDGQRAHTLFHDTGCGPTAIAPYRLGYVVLCHRTDSLVVIGSTGRVLERITSDPDTVYFDNPNDASADGKGGVYFSASGLFSQAVPPHGEVWYLAPDGMLTRVAQKMRYTNGVHFDQRHRRLLVSEHLGARIWAFEELLPGRVKDGEVLVDFAGEAIEPVDRFPLPGPDGLELDAAGNLYAAYYGAGLLFILSPEGEILHRLRWSEPLITNVALDDYDRTLVLTGAQITNSQLAPGLVERIANPVYAD